MNDVFTHKSDAEVWESFRQGSQHAFAYIYEQHIQYVYNYGRQVCQDEALIEDCIQELFIDLWNRKHALSQVSSIKFYLFKAIQRKIKHELVKRRRFVADEGTVEKNIELEASCEALLIDIQHQEEQQKMLLRNMRRLPENQQKALTLKFYENLSYQEIADAMSLNTANVYKIISRALFALKKDFHHFHILFPLVLLFPS